jgi:hypothetical protein
MTAIRTFRRYLMTVTLRLLVGLAVLLSSVHSIDAKGGSGKAGGPYEVYFLIDDQAVWMGDIIRYTVYEPTVVEARILSASGEIILIYREGELAPGQYTLMWDGTVDGSPLAGYYTFELYFGDEYAAKFPMVVNPLPKAP